MKKTYPGRLIALEGIDGSGTTTQLHRLQSRLQQNGFSVLTTCEPSDRAFGRLIRKMLRGELPSQASTLALAFAADRTDHIQHEILPALERGDIVLTDRYVVSSLAYQASVGMHWVQEINRHAIPTDLTVFFSVDADTAATRREQRGGPEELFDQLETQRKIDLAYREAIQIEGFGPVQILDASQSVDKVTEDLYNLVVPVLGVSQP